MQKAPGVREVHLLRKRLHFHGGWPRQLRVHKPFCSLLANGPRLPFDCSEPLAWSSSLPYPSSAAAQTELQGSRSLCYISLQSIPCTPNLFSFPWSGHQDLPSQAWGSLLGYGKYLCRVPY